MDVPRAEFETTIDEIVDANHKLARQTKAYWRQVHVAQASTGIAFAVAVLASLMTKRRCDCVSSQAIAIIVSIAIAGGALIAYLYRPVHVWLFRRSTRRVFVEMMHGDGPIHCVMELRDNQLSCKSKHSEVSLPWSPATRIVDAADAIEMWFDPGLAIVPNRAFRTADDRVAFLSAAHRLAAAPRQGTAMVAIPGLGWQDVAVVQSLLRGADFICRVHDSPGELGRHAILIREADQEAIKAFLADYRIRDQFDRLHPIPWQVTGSDADEADRRWPDGNCSIDCSWYG